MGYSREIKTALSDTLALFAVHPGALRATGDLREWTPHAVVRELLDKPGIDCWVELGPQLPVLAEAAPEAFLSSVELLLGRPEDVDALYAKEREGSTPMVGILWALENLAWSPEYLPRATLALGGLDVRDPGGSWTNRAKYSLTHIYLPWLPQTTANVAKRLAALTALASEYPETAWAVLAAGLPNATVSSSGTHRPKWRGYAPRELPPVTGEEYRQQVEAYGDRLVEMAAGNETRLPELTNLMADLPLAAFGRALRELTNFAERSPEDSEVRLRMWRTMERIAVRHSRFPDADWSMSEARITDLRSVAKLFEPTSPATKYLPLFSTSSFDLYQEAGSFEQSKQKLADAQTRAAAELWQRGELTSLIDFAGRVDRPYPLGWATASNETLILSPNDLRSLSSSTDPKHLEFLSGYITRRHSIDPTGLIDGIDFGEWRPTEIAAFFRLLLPVTRPTWRLAETLLGKHRAMFWKDVDLQLVDTESDIRHVTKQLLSVNRPLSALGVLYSFWQKSDRMDEKLACRILLSAASANDRGSSIDAYQIVETIKIIQNAPGINIDDLIKIEWAYLDLLESNFGDASPVTIERQLAIQPELYCNLIRTIFRSENTPPVAVRASEAEQRVASNAYRLISEWKIPPGTKDGEAFDGEVFVGWLDEVIQSCQETGHLVVALHQLGSVLVHVPNDASGLWIDLSVARALNRADLADLRTGYRMGIFNARGAHWVDPTGAPELELSSIYRQRADEADARSLPRLAATMRDLAREYAADAERIRVEHSGDDSEL